MELTRFPQLRIVGHYRIDGINFHRRLPPDVGDHVILGLLPCKPDRLSYLLEKIYDRRAAELESFGVYAAARRRHVVEVNVYFEMAPKACVCRCFKSR